MSEDLSRGGCPKSVSRGFSLEILEPWGHGSGEFSTMSTFHQGQEYSQGAWLGKSLASKEGWPWVGGKQEAGEGLHPALLKAPQVISSRMLRLQRCLLLNAAV